MEVKVFKNNLNVGKNDYIKLHNDILKCKNLSSIKKLFDIFNKKYSIDYNTYHQGVTINQEFVYIIENKLNGKKYIGETNNLISRFYSYVRLDKVNNELMKDIIDLGMLEFNIDFKKSNDRKELEKKLIKKYIKNCYNIIYAEKNVSKKIKKSYNIGNLNFTSKVKIKEYCRNLLDSYNSGDYIDLDSNDGIFATSMIKLHPNYDGFIDYSKDIKLSVIRDDMGDAKGLGNWNIFSFEYIDKKNKKNNWGFSTNKIILSL